MMRFGLIIGFLLLPLSTISAQQTGAADFGLGGSSVSWSPSPAALYLNPAELARVRQNDFIFNAHRFTGLSSFSGLVFVPNAGSFAAGAGTLDSSSQYTVGYALPVGDHHAFGIALSGFRKTKESFGISFGGSLHFPGNTENSGLHAGVSINNLSENTSSPLFSINLGAGYWVAAEVVRVQGAFQHTAAKNYGLFAVEALPLPWLSVQVGTRSFKEIRAGLSLRFRYGSVDLGAGKQGVVFSVRAALSELASEQRDSYARLAEEAVGEERLTDAAELYRTAISYDPFFAEGITAADTIEGALRTQAQQALQQAATLLAKKDFVEATRTYSRVLRMDPKNEEARKNIITIQPRMRSYVSQLIVSGDSLREKREIERARRSYLQAQELDPENDSLNARIRALQVLAREGVRTMLSRAQVFLVRNQLDDAQREFERVLDSEPRNAQARQGLAEIRSKRRDGEVERGKQLADAGSVMEALTIFLEVLKQDSRHQEAKAQADRARQILLPEADNYFRSGLQMYTKENYKAALEEWEKALLIHPSHQGTLEYKKRAEEKLKALERLK